MIIKIKSNYYINSDDIIYMIDNSGIAAENLLKKYKNGDENNSSMIVNLSGRRKKTRTLILLKNGLLIFSSTKADTIFKNNFGREILIPENEDETEGPQ